MRRISLLLAIVALIFVFAGAREPRSARAASASFVVSNLNDGGPGSLRQAINDASGNAGPNTITFTVTGTIHITSDPLSISRTTSVIGPGAASLMVDLSGCACGSQLGVACACGLFLTPTGGNSASVSGITFSGGGLGLLGNSTLSNAAIVNTVGRAATG